MATKRTTAKDCFDSLDAMHWELMYNIKGYFCLRYENHTVLDEFMELCVQSPSKYIAPLVKRFQQPITGVSEAPLPTELEEFLTRPFKGVFPAKKFIRSREVLLLATLFTVRSYKSIYKRDFETALRDLCAAENFFGFFMGGSDLIFGENSISAVAQSGAKAKLRADPKQAAKQQVRDCWELWQKEPARYKSKSAFAKDMLEKFPSHKDEKGRQAGLESPRVIERWCKEWESEPS